jgi:hypothetical protein
MRVGYQPFCLLNRRQGESTCSPGVTCNRASAFHKAICPPNPYFIRVPSVAGNERVIFTLQLTLRICFGLVHLP